MGSIVENESGSDFMVVGKSHGINYDRDYDVVPYPTGYCGNRSISGIKIGGIKKVIARGFERAK
jgi:hypothetical protein